MCLWDLAEGRLCSEFKVAGGEVAQVPGVAALAASPADANLMFAAAGSSLMWLDVRQPGGVVHSRSYHQEDVGCVLALPASARNTSGTSLGTSLLAAGDDSGQIKVIDVGSRSLVKSLRGGHSNIVSGLCSRPHRPAELLSGGLDALVVSWDHARGKRQHAWDMGPLAGASAAAAGQLANPPLVHALAAPPPSACHAQLRLLAVATGSGAIVLLDADARNGGSSGSGSSSSRGKGTAGVGGGMAAQRPAAWLLDAELGGHNAAASCLCFASAAAATEGGGASTSGCVLVSGGDDRSLCFWDYDAVVEGRAPAGGAALEALQMMQTAPGGDVPSTSDIHSGATPAAGNSNAAQQPTPASALLTKLAHKRKINGLAAAPMLGRHLLAVADVSKSLAVYQLQSTSLSGGQNGHDR